MDRRQTKAGLMLGLVFLVVLSGSACSAKTNQAPQKRVAATKGDGGSSVTGNGNLSLLREADLSFEVSGKLVEIPVEEGGKVVRGQPIARLDDGSFQLAVAAAEAQHKAAQKQLEAADLDVQAAGNHLRVAAADVEGARQQLQVAKTEAEIADYSLRQSEIIYNVVLKDGVSVVETTDLTDIAFTDLPGARFAVQEAGHYLGMARELLAGGDPSQAQAQIDLAREKLALAEKKTEGKRAQAPLDVKVKVLQVEKALASLKATGSQVDKAGIALETAKLNASKARIALETAKLDVEKARIALEKARDDVKKTVLLAPFDGIVARIEGKAGDIVSALNTTGRIVFKVVDASRMELKADVDEIDIPKVKPGQKAAISIDALPDVKLEGEVGFVAPVGTKASGVVMYQVKIVFNVPEGPGLKAGMSASARIMTG